MTLVGLLVMLLLVALILWAVKTVLGVSGLPPPITTVIFVIVVVLCVLWIITSLGVLPAGPVLRLR